MTTVTTETALDRFIKQTRELFASRAGPREALGRADAGAAGVPR